jgi:hypothetical protein
VTLHKDLVGPLSVSAKSSTRLWPSEKGEAMGPYPVSDLWSGPGSQAREKIELSCLLGALVCGETIAQPPLLQYNCRCIWDSQTPQEQCPKQHVSGGHPANPPVLGQFSPARKLNQGWKGMSIRYPRGYLQNHNNSRRINTEKILYVS